MDSGPHVRNLMLRSRWATAAMISTEGGVAVMEVEAVAAAVAEAVLAEGPSGVVAVSTGIDCYSSVCGDGLRQNIGQLGLCLSSSVLALPLLRFR